MPRAALLVLLWIAAALSGGCARASVDPDARMGLARGARELATAAQGSPQRTLGHNHAAEDRRAVLMAATVSRGLALVDAKTSSILALAHTTYPARDIAYDPWTGRWFVAEYDDSSANLISVWRAEPLSETQARLRREASIETGGDCRIVAIRQGVVVFEDDGLQQRWMLSDRSLHSMRIGTFEPLPTGLVLRAAPNATLLIAAVVRDLLPGPRATLISERVDAQGLHTTQQVLLPAWAQNGSPLRLRSAAGGGVVIGQLQARTLSIAAMDDSGQPLRGPIRVLLPNAISLEDMVYDDASASAFVLTAGSDRLVSVNLATGEVATFVLPGGAPAQLASVFSRMLALDPGARRLIVANAQNTTALQWSVAQQPAALRPVADWKGQGLRWPIELGMLPSGSSGSAARGSLSTGQIESVLHGRSHVEHSDCAGAGNELVTCSAHLIGGQPMVEQVDARQEAEIFGDVEVDTDSEP
jgi:hypothetical protein